MKELDEILKGLRDSEISCRTNKMPEARRRRIIQAHTTILSLFKEKMMSVVEIADIICLKATTKDGDWLNDIYPDNLAKAIHKELMGRLK